MMIDTLGIYRRLRDNAGMPEPQARAVAEQIGRAWAEPDFDPAQMRQQFCEAGFTAEQAAVLTDILGEASIEYQKRRNRWT